MNLLWMPRCKSKATLNMEVIDARNRANDARKQWVLLPVRLLQSFLNLSPDPYVGICTTIWLQTQVLREWEWSAANSLHSAIEVLMITRLMSDCRHHHHLLGALPLHLHLHPHPHLFGPADTAPLFGQRLQDAAFQLVCVPIHPATP